MKRPLGYVDGLGAGIAIIATAIGCWLSWQMPGLDGMYRDMGGPRIGSATQLVLSPTWRLGVPLVLVAAITAAHVWRPRYALLGVAVVAIGIDIFWYLAAWSPIFEVAGNIR